MPRRRRAETVDEKLLRRWPLPRIDPQGSKDTRGSVLVVGGAPQMPGAVVLAAIAALRAGAGKLQIATVRSVAPFVGIAVPEALVVGLPETGEGGISPSAAREIAGRAEGCSAVLVGPGMVDTAAAAKLVAALLGRLEKIAVVLDAEALACASMEPRAMASAKSAIALTPHAREMAKMLDVEPAEIERDRAEIAVRAARLFHAAVALKGPQTFIAAPSGRLLCNRRAGNAGLGTSGSGDTLAGIVAGLAARGADLLQAVAWAVFLHGRAGDVLARKIGPVGYLARELLDGLPHELSRLTPRR